MPELNPEDLIDRKAEQELFGQLVTFTTPARLLTICDGGGRGKSSLLKRLQYNCRFVIDPNKGIPACLIELDKMQPSPFLFVAHVVENLKSERSFAQFNVKNEKRMLKDFSIFSKDELTSFRDPRTPANLQASSTVQGPMGEKAISAGAYFENATLKYDAPQFTDEQEQAARQKCIEAFFDDLRAVCAAQPVVLILDAWERCDSSLLDWIRREFLRNHCLNRDRNLRPDKLAIVVAGRPHHPTKTPNGLRPDEFRDLFANDQNHADAVMSIKSLSRWEKQHVREFLIMNGYEQPSDADLDLIQEKLNENWSIERVLKLIDVFKSQS